MRFIHPVTKTADKCDFCRKTHLQAGKLPACVEACPTKALTFGNLDDPNSEISQLLRQKPTYRYKLALGANRSCTAYRLNTGGEPMTQTSAFHFESLVWDWPIAIYLF